MDKLAIWLPIKVPGASSLDVLTLCGTPRRDSVVDSSLLEVLAKISKRLGILIVCNFNAPRLDWSSAWAHSSGLAFDGCLQSRNIKSFLTQYATFPTDVHDGQQANCLELVLPKSHNCIGDLS
ncbi:unnamed protein product [Dibothriocephalus latus]|uniref:Endonuclease/exonuclease/phosphatase domain-containing protein n=1 Tax=Dibothriocephalus latus TaxID=60516 RepID=A0A3P7Q2M6_DIBLA|nr:unnamed protein product [Dibothriocephalus latus]